jgi:hypothetical protein
MTAEAGGSRPTEIEQDPVELANMSAGLNKEFHDAQTEFELEDPDTIDWDSDPLVAQDASEEPSSWNHSIFKKFVPRESKTVPDGESLRGQMRELLKEIESGPPESDGEESEERLTEWLRSVENKLHPVKDFVAGSFGRHAEAWEELLGQSSRPSSKSVLSWIRSGIKPSFAGTGGCDPKKLERVRRML